MTDDVGFSDQYLNALARVRDLWHAIGLEWEEPRCESETEEAAVLGWWCNHPWGLRAAIEKEVREDLDDGASDEAVAESINMAIRLSRFPARHVGEPAWKALKNLPLVGRQLTLTVPKKKGDILYSKAQSECLSSAEPFEEGKIGRCCFKGHEYPSLLWKWLHEGDPPKEEPCYAASENDERWGPRCEDSDRPTREEAVANLVRGYGVEPGRTVFSGRPCEYRVPRNAIDADSVLERLGIDAYDVVGDVAEEWPDPRPDETLVLEERLNAVLHKWLDEFCVHPSFYMVVDVEKHVVEEE